MVLQVSFNVLLPSLSSTLILVSLNTFLQHVLSYIQRGQLFHNLSIYILLQSNVKLLSLSRISLFHFIWIRLESFRNIEQLCKFIKLGRLSSNVFFSQCLIILCFQTNANLIEDFSFSRIPYKDEWAPHYTKIYVDSIKLKKFPMIKKRYKHGTKGQQAPT